MAEGVTFYSGNEDANSVPSYNTQPPNASTSDGPVQFYKGESDGPRSFDGTDKSWDMQGSVPRGSELVSPTDK